MNRQNIEQIIRDLFKGNCNACTNCYDFSNDNGQQARLTARITAKGYWDSRNEDEIARDQVASVTKDDYVNWCLAELKEQQEIIN